MSFLLDTNVVAELRKGARCNSGLARWFTKAADSELFLSVLTLGEIRKGIELVRPRDPLQAEALERWLRGLRQDYATRLLPIDGAVADLWGRLSSLRPLSVIDSLLAATAQVNRLTLVTRNAVDVAGIGVELLNPFD